MPVIAAFLAALGPWIARYFVARAAFFIAKILGVVGISLATNELLIDPLLDHLEAAWAAMPPGAVEWARFFGMNQVLSIALTASAIVGVKQVFMSKRD